MYYAGFLQDAINKEELFNLPTEDVVKHDYPPSKHVYTNSGSHVKLNCADTSMSANDHQETDRRICLHVDDALNDGATTFLVRTVDTDGCSYGSALARGSTSATTASTQSAKNLRRKKLVLCPCSPLLRF